MDSSKTETSEEDGVLSKACLRSSGEIQADTFRLRLPYVFRYSGFTGFMFDFPATIVPKGKTFINYNWRFTAAGAHRSKPQSDRFIYRPLTVQNHYNDFNKA